MEKALKLSPLLSTSHLAHQAVLMAEGRAEEAIQPGRRALDLDPTSAHAYTAWARSHLLAACAQGCAARESLRTEKRKEKSLGRRSQLEVREEEQRRAQEQRQSGKRPSTLDRSTLRAGAMWRIMEAGRLWKQGAAAEPNSEEAQLFHRMSKHLLALDKFGMLDTEQVITFGECKHFFGQKVDGHLCDKKRYKYE